MFNNPNSNLLFSFQIPVPVIPIPFSQLIKRQIVVPTLPFLILNNFCLFLVRSVDETSDDLYRKRQDVHPSPFILDPRRGSPDWFALLSNREQWRQRDQQHRMLVLFYAFPHVRCSYAHRFNM